MNWLEIISLLLNLLLGTGFIVTLATLRSTKRAAVADAKAKELDNVDAAITIWRGLAEKQAEQYCKVLDELEKLRKEVNRLNRINTKIVKLLDILTPENMEAIVEQIKQEINDETKHDAVARMHTTITDGSQL